MPEQKSRAFVVVTDAFGGMGGIAKFNRDLLGGLCALPSIESVHCVPRRIQGELGELPEGLDYRSDGAKGKWAFIKAALSASRALRRADLVICGHINLLPVAAAVARMRGCRLLLVIHGIDAWQPNPKGLVNRMIPSIDCTIAVSDITRQRFMSWADLPSHCVKILPNSIDLAAYTPGERDASLGERYGIGDKKVIMTLGVYDAEQRDKGVDQVLGVLPQIEEQIGPTKYMIAGGGSDLERLRELAEGLDLGDDVFFPGFIDEDEKVAHLRLADLFIMPGTGEGFGIVYLEAMACGVPVIASTADGSREAVMEGELGELVDPEMPADIVRGVKTAIKRTRGVVPAGLDYFSGERFLERLGVIIDSEIEASASVDAE